MIEEAYETVEAINLKDDDNLKEELGDVLLQVVMHARIAGEAGRFDMTDVVDGVTRKMIRRHPHIFGNGNVQTPEAVAAAGKLLSGRRKMKPPRLRESAECPGRFRPISELRKY